MVFDWIDATISNIRDYTAGRNNVLYLIVADSWARNAEKYGVPHNLAVDIKKAVEVLKPRAANDCYAEMRRCIRESTEMAESGDIIGAKSKQLLAVEYADGFLRFSE